VRNSCRNARSRLGELRIRKSTSLTWKRLLVQLYLRYAKDPAKAVLLAGASRSAQRTGCLRKQFPAMRNGLSYPATFRGALGGRLGFGSFCTSARMGESCARSSPLPGCPYSRSDKPCPHDHTRRDSPGGWRRNNVRHAVGKAAADVAGHRRATGHRAGLDSNRPQRLWRSDQ
jgi:hypothetical protein